MATEGIYFDNAATTFPKPRSVYEATLRAMREYGGNPGRGAHRFSRLAAKAVYDCREVLSEFVGAGGPDRIVFTVNATAAINLAVKGLLRPGDHVLISDMEHNAVWRPIYKMAREGHICYEVFRTFPEREPDTVRLLSEIESRIRPETRAIVCAHASNICSAVLPLEEIGKLCRRRGIFLVVDASQSLGHIPVDMKRMQIDLLCGPGHKGLYGPLGSGFLAVGDGILLDTLTEGGNGVLSLEGTMPDTLPERYEAGTLAVPAIAGLGAGVREVMRRGTDAIREQEHRLFRRLRDRLDGVPGLWMLAPERVGSVLSFCVDGIPSERMAELLDDRGFAVRAGFHCSALGHETLATREDGAVRVSFGMFNTRREVDRFADHVVDICKGK